MSRTVAALCLALLVSCAPADEQPAEEAVDTPMIALADVAGTWSMRALPETGDSALVTYQMTATDNTSGWTVTFPDREPVAARIVAVEGDSIVVDLGPYESALRAGVMVSTRSIMRLQEGNLVGTFVARYETTEPDSVLRGRQEGTRAQ